MIRVVSQGAAFLALCVSVGVIMSAPDTPGPWARVWLGHVALFNAAGAGLALAWLVALVHLCRPSRATEVLGRSMLSTSLVGALGCGVLYSVSALMYASGDAGVAQTLRSFLSTFLVLPLGLTLVYAMNWWAWTRLERSRLQGLLGVLLPAIGGAGVTLAWLGSPPSMAFGRPGFLSWYSVDARTYAVVACVVTGVGLLAWVVRDVCSVYEDEGRA